MIEQTITIYKDVWVQGADGLYHAHVPTLFECNDSIDTIMELADDQAYINDHFTVFDNLRNGYTGNNEVVISCTIKPDCDIKVIVKTLEEAGGRILYDKFGNPEYIPNNNQTNSGIII